MRQMLHEGVEAPRFPLPLAAAGRKPAEVDQPTRVAGRGRRLGLAVDPRRL